MQTAQPKNILIIRLSAIGDVVMASGLLPSLHALYPEAKISWLTEPATASLLRDHSLLEQVIVWDKAAWKKRWKSGEKLGVLKDVLAFRRQLKQANFDLVLDTQGLLKSGIWAWMSGAKRRVGLGSKEGSQHLMTEVTPRDDGAIISSEYRGLVKYLGADDAFVEQHYKMSLNQFSDSDPLAEFKASKLSAEQASQFSDYIVLCPYTTRPQKHWFDHHWIELAKQLESKYQLPCLVLGGPPDKPLAEKLVAQMPNAFNLAGETSLMASNQVISNARFVVGVDTGITHMGIMHNVPTVTIFGSTCPYSQAPNTKVLYLNKPCSPCRRRPTCGGSFDCLLEITPDMVIEALAQLELTIFQQSPCSNH
ncbi:glycosyltransferase family 9 protein [Paraneptunicella aestuarii]|uniref:glycosyltransferase family 9 protein n=1 Tax=Paraneptunicella aestuarii TaxID=2831148 RepID=UPI001E5E3F68|nr:glycosyltransferase family 9 protein [Paraneptunicella aestuarii]UAA38857.1 glycosyltransferase family 9 protein [Paraneptunicella aestuarii]